MTTNTAARGGAEFHRGFLATLSQMAEAYRRSRARRRHLIALSALEDHVLLDIGFDPGAFRRPHQSQRDWVVQTQSGPARLLFIGH